MISIIRYLIILILLFRTVYTDFKEDKIRNKDLVICLILGLMISVLNGKIVEMETIGISFLVVLSLFPLFLLKGLGGGDIKLFAVLTFFYKRKILWIIIVSFFIGGIIGIIQIIYQKIKKKEIYIKKERIHFSFPIAIATFLITIWR